MKRLATLVTLLPTVTLAHGTHAPVPAEAHQAAHMSPFLAAALVAAAIGLVLYQRWRQ